MTPHRHVLTALLVAFLPLLPGGAAASDFDLVLRDARVMDPASGLDAVRNVGIREGRIAALSREPLDGAETVDLGGLVLAPGFIDLHAHGQRPEEAWLQARDGVTTQLEMEAGTYPVAPWYERRAGTAPIHYGATVSHITARVATLVDLASLGLREEDLAGLLTNPKASDAILADRRWVDGAADDAELAAIERRLQAGLDDGALGIGYGINYTPGATRKEIFRLFELARDNGVTNFVHARFGSNLETGGGADAVQELIADAAATGAGVHVVHIGSTGMNHVPLLLEMIDGARDNGVDISTEVYPYTAFSTFIGAAIFDGDFRDRMGMDYGDIELPQTGERINAARFEQLRAEAPQTIIVGHAMDDRNVTTAIAHPGVMIASDGMVYRDGRAHPRGAGTFSRVLGVYVRERGALGLMEALGKMSYLPAARLEQAVPQMRRKGRIEVGADADLVVFDPERVIDRATFAEPALPSAGIAHVIVAGEFVVRDAQPLMDRAPGLPVRREVR